MMSGYYLSDATKFVARRAFRFGKVDRADVREAFDLRDAPASGVLTLAAQQVKELERLPRWVAPKPWSYAPAWANAKELMEAIDRGHDDFKTTGLRAHELPVNRVQWSAAVPKSTEALNVVLQAIVHSRACAIQYVGVKLGETARWRRIFPLGLERMGDQWRVYAHDLEHAEFAVRTFVLARIEDAAELREKLPKKFTPAAASDAMLKFAPVLDGRYTQDQRRALLHELRVEDGVIRLPRRAEFEFLRRFGEVAASADAVWPPIKLLEPK